MRREEERRGRGSMVERERESARTEVAADAQASRADEQLSVKSRSDTQGRPRESELYTDAHSSHSRSNLNAIHLVRAAAK